jgi:O-antigen/teichoic acid export membrane protein
LGVVVRQSSLVSIFGLAGVGVAALTAFWLLPLAFPDRPEDYGLLRWIISVATILGLVLHAGLPQTVITFVPRWNVVQRAQFFTYGWAVILALTALAAATVHLWLWPWFDRFDLGTDLGLSTTLAVILMAAAFTVHEWYLGWFTANGRIALPQIVKDFGRKSSLLVVVVVYLIWRPELSSVILGLALWYALLTVGVVLVYHRTTREPLGSLAAQPEGQKYALWLLWSLATQMVFGQLDILLLGRWVGLDEVARYSIAFQIGIVLGVPSKSMNQAIRPFVAQYWAEGKRAELRALMLRSARSQWGLSLLLYVLILAVLPAVYTLLPAAYQDRGPMIAAVAGATQMIYIATGATGMVLLTSEKFRHDWYANVIMIVLSVGFAAWAVPQWGALGMAWALLAAAVVYNSFRMVQLWRWFQISAFDQTFWRFLPWIGAAAMLHWLLPGFGWGIWNTAGIEFVAQCALFVVANNVLNFAPDLRTSSLSARFLS